MNTLPLDIRINIFQFIEDELQSYWKNYFTNNIIIVLNPKIYFTKYVLPLLDKGWKNITIYSGPCTNCSLNGYRIYNQSCEYCYNSKPCLNYYWYNSDPYNTHGGCFCDGIQEWISWDQIKEHYPFYKQKYLNYYDFIKSKEWLNYLDQEYMAAIQNN